MINDTQVLLLRFDAILLLNCYILVKPEGLMGIVSTALFLNL